MELKRTAGGKTPVFMKLDQETFGLLQRLSSLFGMTKTGYIRYLIHQEKRWLREDEREVKNDKPKE